MMNRILIVALVLFSAGLLLTLRPVTATAEERQPPMDQDEYTLVWSDEFEEDGPPNPENWDFDHGFVRNRELQWYQSDNAYCRNGQLVIEARKEKRPNPTYDPTSNEWNKKREHIEYTSSIISTWGKHEWRFGRFEIRAKVDVSDGLWPAIWTIGTADRKWPANGEIDIMEYYRGRIMANAAWARPGEYQSRWDSSATFLKDLPNRHNWSKRFHVWRMDWTEDYIRLYLDDHLLNEIDLSKTINETPDKANPFHDPHYLILNLAVGGTNGGDPSDTKFPRQFVVDYVRVYQKKPAEEAANEQ